MKERFLPCLQRCQTFRCKVIIERLAAMGGKDKQIGKDLIGKYSSRKLNRPFPPDARKKALSWLYPLRRGPRPGPQAPLKRPQRRF